MKNTIRAPAMISFLVVLVSFVLLSSEIASVKAADKTDSVVTFTIEDKYSEPSGEDPGGNDPSGEDPGGKDPSGKDPSGQDPNGKLPNGQDAKGSAIDRLIGRLPQTNEVLIAVNLASVFLIVVMILLILQINRRRLARKRVLKE